VSAPLRPEGLAFLHEAPFTYVVSAPVPAPPADVFAAVVADPSTWSWYPGLAAGGYEGEGPPGVGSRRWVRMGGTTYRETVLAWDEPRAMAYRVDEASVPLARALVEEWAVVADPLGGGSVVRWTFAADPRPLLTAARAAAPLVMGTLFRRAMANLGATLA
jgi:hypothetical protein